jgi:flagellar motor switch protein FliN
MKSEGNTEVDSEKDVVNDDEIEKMLAEATGADAGAEAASDAQATGEAAAGGEAIESAAGRDTAAAADDLSVEDRANQLLNEVDAGLEAAVSGSSRPGSNVRSEVDDARPFQFGDLGSDTPPATEQEFSIGMLDDVQLNVQIELGRAELLIDEVLAMREGVVVPLDKLAGDPIDIVVNGRLLGRGEVLVLNDNFCVRVVEIVASST